MQTDGAPPCYHRCVRRILLPTLCGLLAGALLAVMVSANWWEYQRVRTTDARDAAINWGGWHVAPGQSNPLHLRRSRFHLP